MAYTVREFRSTPNPNAVMCMVSPSPLDPASPVPRSYFRPGDADPGEDPLAAELFAVEGVASLLIHGEFITINKAPGAKWPGIRRGVTRVLEAAETPGG